MVLSTNLNNITAVVFDFEAVIASGLWYVAGIGMRAGVSDALF